MSTLRCVLIVFFVFVFVFGDCLRANDKEMSLSEVLGEKVSASSNLYKPTKEKMCYFEDIYAELRQQTFRQVGTVKGQKNTRFVPNLLLNASIDNANPGTGQQFCYKIKYRCASITEHCYNAQISFELPNSMEILSVPSEFGNVSQVTQVGNQVTINLVSPTSAGAPDGALAAGSAGLLKVCATFKCEDEAGVTAGSMVNFVTDPTFSVTGGSATASTGDVTVPTLTTCAVTLPPPPATSIYKDQHVNTIRRYGFPGSELGYQITIPTHTSAFEVYDTFPNNFYLNNNYFALEPGYVFYFTCNGVEYPVMSGNNNSYDASGEVIIGNTGDFITDTLGVNTGCTVTRVTYQDGSFIVYADNATSYRISAPANGNELQIYTNFYVGEDTPCGTYQNILHSSIPATFPAESHELEVYCNGEDLNMAHQCVGNLGTATLTTDEDFHLAYPNLTVDPLDAQYAIIFNNTSHGVTNINGAVAEVLLEEYQEFSTDPQNPNYWAVNPGASSQPLDPDCYNPSFEIIPNYSGSRTLLRWTFPASCTLPGNYTEPEWNAWLDVPIVYLYFSLRYNLSQPLTEFASEATVKLLDGRKTKTASGDCTLPTGSSINSAKYVKGTFDTKMHRYPLIGNTDTTGTGDYELYIYQSGFDNIAHIHAADILPYIGDVDMLSPAISRGSEWSMELMQAITVERYKIGTGLLDATADLGVDGVYYSTSTNPCYLTATNNVSVSGGNGTNPSCNSFSTGGSAVGARSWGFHWSNTGDPLVFGEYLKITMKGQQLSGENAKTNLEVAWNAFAYSTVNTTGDTLTSQPIKVGLKMIDESKYSALGDYIWKDDNGNGVQEENEQGIVGVFVSLYNVDGTPVADTTIIGSTTTIIPRKTVTTDSTGYYCFRGLQPNTNYIIRLDSSINYMGSGPLTSYTLTTTNASMDETLDSDGVMGNSGGIFASSYPEISIATTSSAGVKDTTYALGFYQPASICGHAFEDADLEGDEDVTEAHVANIIVIAKDLSGNEVTRDTTDIIGTYNLTLPPGTYNLTIDTNLVSGYVYTASNVTGEDVADSDVSAAGEINIITVAECGDISCDNDIGLRIPPANPATIKGTVWDELTKDGVQDGTELGLQDILVYLLDANGFVVTSTTTDVSGNYEFNNLDPGLDYSISVVPTVGLTFTNQDIGGNDLVDSDVNITTGVTNTITPAANATVDHVDAGLCGNYSLGNLVWHDANDNGIVDNGEGIFSNVEVYLKNADTGTYIDTTVTDANGKYIFTALSAGRYIVEVKIPTGGYRSSTDIGSTENPNTSDNDDNGVGIIASGNAISDTLMIAVDGGANGDPNWLESDHGTPIAARIDNTSNPKAYYTMDFGFYRPGPCQLSSNITYNTCVDNTDGTFTANYNVNISWIDGPVEDIQVLVNGIVAQTVLSGNTSPQTVAIDLAADGVGQDTIITRFATTTTCADTLILKSPNPCPNNVATCANATGCIGGKAFEDFNCNGTDDTAEDGIQGIQVVVYDCQNNAVDTVWTDNDGDWQLCGLTDGAAYRVEFTLPESIACWASPTHAGSDNGTDVQFLTAPACTKFGLSNPKDYCEADPFVIIPCYSMGAFDGATSGEPAIVKLRESAEGHDFTGTTKTVDFEAVTLADHNDVGAVYGVAWQPTKERYYLSAFHKRYVGYGPDGPDAIYQYDLDGNKTGTINLDAILATTNSAGSDVHDFTPADVTDPHPGEIYDLGIGDISFDGVGKRAFGDIELSDDDSTLYVINLFDKKIYGLDVSAGSTASVTISQTWDTPDETTAGRHRPFALAFHQGKLWVGSVDENGSNAYVHSLLPTETTFNLELTIPLNYNRQAFIQDADYTDALSNWNAWATTANVSYGGDIFAFPPEIGYPQPILSDIEFADNGDMILGFRDRFGDQSGAGVYLNADETELTYSISAGDILKACFQSGSFVLETGGGSCAGTGGISPSGPGGTEFYSWDIYNFEDIWSPLKPVDNPPSVIRGAIHWETTQGALLQLKGKPYVMTSAMDPFSDYSGGVLKLNNTTGGREGVDIDSVNYAGLVGGYTLFDSEEFPLDVEPTTLGKANGLGDLEAACESAPLEIGNYVWCDSIRNGIQDACEKGIDSLIVQLYDQNGRLIGQDTTTNGQYYFNQYNVDTTGISVDGSGVASPITAWSGMDYSTPYFIVFGNSQYNNSTGRLLVGDVNYEGFTIHDVNSNANDNIDSDIDTTSLTMAIGDMLANLPVINMTTNATGCGDHKFDVGLICPVYDYGDLPDIADGTTGVTDYETYDSTGGPSHQIIAGLFLGDTVDMETDGFPDALAFGDDNDNVDDEDGVTIFPSLRIIPGGTLKLPLAVTNTTGDTAHLEAWIDWDADGDFDESNEMIVDLQDNEDGVFPSFLTIDVPTNIANGVQVGFRIRLSNEDDMTPYGRVASGEVEDYLLGIDCPQPICLPIDLQINKE